MKIFILEDDPYRISRFREAAMNLDATFAVDMSEVPAKFQPPYDVMFLDHDLGGMQMVSSEEENTGYQFVKNLPVAGNISSHVLVHSYNAQGAMNMVRTLHEKGYSAIYSPFGPSVLSYMESLGSRTMNTNFGTTTV